MRQYFEKSNIIVKDCPIHGFYAIKRNLNNTNHRYTNNFYSDIQEPNVFYAENDSPYLSNNINEFNDWNQNTYILPSRQYNNQINNLSNYSLQPDNSYDNNYGFYLSSSNRLRPNLTVNNNSSINNHQNYNNFVQRHLMHINSPVNYGNRIISSKSSDLFTTRRTNLNNYNNRSNSNIYGEESFIKTIRPKKTLRYNTFSHDNYNNNDYINANYYYVEEPILTQRNFNLYQNQISDINRNRNNHIKKRNVITQSNSFHDQVIKKNNQINENYFKQYNKIRNVKNNINKYFVLPKNKGDDNNRKSYRKTNYDNINNNRKRIVKNKNNAINLKKEIKNKQEYPINVNNIKNQKDNEVKKEIKERNELVKKKINDFKNHILYISNNKINNKSSLHKKIYRIKNKSENDELIQDRNIKKNRNINMSHDLERIDENDIEKYIIRRRQKKELKKEENNQDDEGKLEQHTEKYYDSQGNFVGGKNIIIKRNYENNGENLIEEIIKEEFNSNVNNYNNYVPKNEEEGQCVIDNQNNNFFYPDDEEPKKIRDDEKNDKKGIVPFSRAPNNIRGVDEEKNRLDKIEDDDKNRNFTFGTRSDSLRIELEDKDEKEANEQQISVNSEFDDESEKK